MSEFLFLGEVTLPFNATLFSRIFLLLFYAALFSLEHTCKLIAFLFILPFQRNEVVSISAALLYLQE